MALEKHKNRSWGGRGCKFKSCYLDLKSVRMYNSFVFSFEHNKYTHNKCHFVADLRKNIFLVARNLFFAARTV